MTKSFSVYLDILRLSAALLVFIAHLSSADLTQGKLWQIKAYDQLAVMVFFVMSGYVIAWVTHQKPVNAMQYVIARSSRIYSVLLPALILTAFCDAVGLSLAPTLYHEAAWTYPAGSQWVHYFLSALLLQNIWDLQLNPGINGPLWSLTFEWIYYIMFGCAFFLRGWKRVGSLFLIALLAGPTIVAMSPIWLLGVFIHHLHRQQRQTSSIQSFFCVTAMLLLLLLPPLLHNMDAKLPWIARKNLFHDYLWAILFSLHLLYLPSLLSQWTAVDRFLCDHARPLQMAAVYTFALYLFHRPVIQLVAAVYHPAIDGWGYYLFQWCVTILFTWLVGRQCEHLKRFISGYLHRLTGDSASFKD